jgi:hypothetical protein
MATFNAAERMLKVDPALRGVHWQIGGGTNVPSWEKGACSLYSRPILSPTYLVRPRHFGFESPLPVFISVWILLLLSPFGQGRFYLATSDRSPSNMSRAA